MFKLCLLVCCLLIWLSRSSSSSSSSSSVTSPAEVWRRTFVSQSDLDLGFVRKVPVEGGASWKRKCVMRLNEEGAETNLVCYVEGACVFFALRREQKDGPDQGVRDAVECMTRYGKGDLRRKRRVDEFPLGESVLDAYESELGESLLDYIKQLLQQERIYKKQK